MNPTTWLFRILDLQGKDPEKSDKLIISLKELVRMLFAVVFGLGLNSFANVDGLLDPRAWMLTSVYIAILLSWLGWNFGTIWGPRETHLLSYLIDYSIVVLYWFLIHWAFCVPAVLILMTLMYVLYFAWEVIRFWSVGKHSTKIVAIRRAMWLNLFVGLVFLAGWSAYVNNSTLVPDWVVPLFLVVASLIYRYSIHLIYTRSVTIGGSKNADLTASSVVAGLIEAAERASQSAVAKLSHYRVGAALLADDGTIHSGCNIEFDNYSNTLHAEESAIAALVLSGHRRATHVAVFTHRDTPAFPCGMCLQSLVEIGGTDMVIIAATKSGHETNLLRELLPKSFTL